MTISSYFLRRRGVNTTLRSIQNCGRRGFVISASRRGVDPRVVDHPTLREENFPELRQEEDDYDEEAEKIEEMRIAFALPKNAWFSTDHCFIQYTDEPDVWRFGITSYMKAYFAYVYTINVTCSVGEQITYLSAPVEIEFEAAGVAVDAVPDSHIFTPPILMSYVQGINWPLVHQPRKVMEDNPQHEWILELYWHGDPKVEGTFVDGYPGEWMDTQKYVEFLMSLDPRDLYSRFPSLKVGDPSLCEFNNYDGNSRDRIHKPTWKPEWWPWGPPGS